MKPLSEFATVTKPLHPSGLRNLIMCPWRAVMLYEAEGDEVGGPAADTGSAMHRAVEAMHKEGMEAAASIEAMAGQLPSYPQADLSEAAGLFLRYLNDRRSDSIVLCEEEIRFDIAPSPEDPTGAPIAIIGTVDLVLRDEHGRLSMWDIKTSKKHPIHVLRNTMHQAAAYCIGASFALGETVHPGGIIMPRAKGPMYVPFTWTFSDIPLILEPVRRIVAMIRSGHVYHVPSAENCEWCHAKGPDLCLPRMKRSLPLC